MDNAEIPKLLLVFAEPAPGGGPPLSGAAAERLCRLAGRSLEEMLALCELRFLQPRRERDSYRHAKLRTPEVRAAAAAIALEGRRALFVGKDVGKAMGLPQRRQLMVWHELRGGRVALFPHPSGFSRTWNIPATTRRASEFLCAALEGREVVLQKRQPGRPDSTVETEMRRRKKQLFLEAFRQLGNRTYAAMHAGCDLKQARMWEEEDPAFLEDVREAGLEACDRIEQEAYRRAVVGVEKPVIHQGKLCYRTDENGAILRGEDGKPLLLMEREWSDELLKILLRGAKPEKYARSAFEISGPGGGPIPVAQVHVVLPANGREVQPLRAIEGGKK